MTTKTDNTLLLRRHDKALAALKQTSEKCDRIPPGAWLRDMADARRALAMIYREASRSHHPDSVEWHGLREASLLLESHAAANLTAARFHEPRAVSIEESHA